MAEKLECGRLCPVSLAGAQQSLNTSFARAVVTAPDRLPSLGPKNTLEIPDVTIRTAECTALPNVRSLITQRSQVQIQRRLPKPSSTYEQLVKRSPAAV